MDDGQPRGALLRVNANIRVNSSSCSRRGNNPRVGGLHDNKDPVAATMEAMAAGELHDNPAAGELRADIGAALVVTVSAGAYQFMPSLSALRFWRVSKQRSAAARDAARRPVATSAPSPGASAAREDRPAGGVPGDDCARRIEIAIGFSPARRARTHGHRPGRTWPPGHHRRPTVLRLIDVDEGFTHVAATKGSAPRQSTTASRSPHPVPHREQDFIIRFSR
jgi:hypothetical protein